MNVQTVVKNMESEDADYESTEDSSTEDPSTEDPSTEDPNVESTEDPNEKLAAWTWAHGPGCVCCDDTTGRARSRHQKMEANIPPKFIKRIPITDPEELAQLNIRQGQFVQYHLGDDIIWVRMSKYNELMKWIKAQLSCANCENSKGSLYLCPCRLVKYCDETCQTADWYAHRPICNRGKI
jgi:MYND finger